MQNLHSKVHVVPAIYPAAVSDNTAQVGQIIDLLGYSECEFVIAIGSVADADATFAVLVEHGDDAALADAATVAAGGLNGTVAAAGFQFDSDNTVRKIGYIKSKRYVRLTITPSANSSAATFGAVALLGSPTVAPVSNP